MDPKTDNNPYLGFIYTSFQERATKISHGNTAAHASQHGDKQLGKICAAIAGDEARHEKAYTKIVDELFLRSADKFLGYTCPPKTTSILYCISSSLQAVH